MIRSELLKQPQFEYQPLSTKNFNNQFSRLSLTHKNLPIVKIKISKQRKHKRQFFFSVAVSVSSACTVFAFVTLLFSFYVFHCKYFFFRLQQIQCLNHELRQGPRRWAMLYSNNIKVLRRCKWFCAFPLISGFVPRTCVKTIWLLRPALGCVLKWI